MTRPPTPSAWWLFLHWTVTLLLTALGLLGVELVLPLVLLVPATLCLGAGRAWHRRQLNAVARLRLAHHVSAATTAVLAVIPVAVIPRQSWIVYTDGNPIAGTYFGFDAAGLLSLALALASGLLALSVTSFCLAHGLKPASRK